MSGFVIWVRGGMGHGYWVMGTRLENLSPSHLLQNPPLL